MSLNGLLHLQYAQHVSGTSIPIIRSSRLYVCYYRLWCAVLGCWLSGVRCREAGYVSRKRPPTTSNQALHTIGGSNAHGYSLELLMTDIEVSESWWAYYVINHSVTSSWFFSSLRICNGAWTNTHQVYTQICLLLLFLGLLLRCTGVNVNLCHTEQCE